MITFNYQEVLFVFYISCRVSGVFLVSPLLSNKSVSPTIRLYLSLFTAVLLAFVFYPEYFGQHAKYALPIIKEDNTASLFILAMDAAKELSIGYLIGFMFNIVFEALMLCGEMIDSMIGYSTAQFFDPFSSTFQSLLGQLLLLTGALFMLIYDYHHVFIKMVAISFSMFPLGHFELNSAIIGNITYGTSQLFVYAIKVGAIPIAVLACALVGIAFTIRVVPEMNLLLTGLPMRVLIGWYIMMIAMQHIPPVIKSAFIQFSNIVFHTLDLLKK